MRRDESHRRQYNVILALFASWEVVTPEILLCFYLFIFSPDEWETFPEVIVNVKGNIMSAKRQSCFFQGALILFSLTVYFLHQ